jgi:serine/threonine-protein phosphatase PGAM5
MTVFLYLVRHGNADPHDGPLSALGRVQARHTGERLRDVPWSAIHHGPLERAVQTAEIIAAYQPGVTLIEDELAGDYLPSDPDRAGLPRHFADFLDGFDTSERVRGPRLARAAEQRFAQAGPGGEDTHRLVVTHNLLIGWLVSQAMSGPDWRWLGINQMNCALTVIAYQPDLPAALITFNDASHLPALLRWSGFPASLRPGAS